ncbi:hypothetical protein YQE_12553, partial [Dendroctonus ponderosae]
MARLFRRISRSKRDLHRTESIETIGEADEHSIHDAVGTSADSNTSEGLEPEHLKIVHYRPVSLAALCWCYSFCYMAFPHN